MWQDVFWKRGNNQEEQFHELRWLETQIELYQIPSRYEAILQINKTILYPDFTIRHPRTGKYFYWEHFGLMDDPSYAKNASAKHQLYISNGIIPNIQLITTYETKENPLSAEMANKIV